MANDIDRWRGRLHRLTTRYRHWEQRRARRLNGWSVRRRWATFVLTPLLIFCACGAVLGGPALWILRQTLEASRGAPSPDVAADTYLMALSYNNDDGLIVVLDNDNQDELLRQWHAYRDAMSSTDPPPFRLDYGSLSIHPAAR